MARIFDRKATGVKQDAIDLGGGMSEARQAMAVPCLTAKGRRRHAARPAGKAQRPMRDTALNGARSAPDAGPRASEVMSRTYGKTPKTAVGGNALITTWADGLPSRPASTAEIGFLDLGVVEQIAGHPLQHQMTVFENIAAV